MAALVEGMRSRLLGCLKGSALVTLASKHKIRSSHGSLACSLSVWSREFHFSAPVREGKYHYIEKKRKLRRIRMEDLKARYERLDEEDRPTGCFLCPMRTDVEVNYKNVRLLSQFVSPFSGRIYGRAVTGLCDKKQKEISRAIRRARAMGFMPVTMKYLEYHKDPKLF